MSIPTLSTVDPRGRKRRSGPLLILAAIAIWTVAGILSTALVLGAARDDREVRTGEVEASTNSCRTP